MDTTDNSLAYAGLTILCLFGGCIIGYVLKNTCIHKSDPLLNNGDDSVSEV
jgi:hypothetical protein